MFRHPFSPYISSYSRNFPHIYRHIQEIPPYIPSYSRKKIGKHYFEKDFCLPVRPLSTSLPLQRKSAEDPSLTKWKKLRHFFILHSKSSVKISTFSPVLLAVEKFPLYTINQMHYNRIRFACQSRLQLHSQNLLNAAVLSGSIGCCCLMVSCAAVFTESVRCICSLRIYAAALAYTKHFYGKGNLS